MQYIYARVSTSKQNLDGQLSTLQAAYPKAKVITEKASGKDMQRPEWQQLEANLQQGDTVIVYDLSRLGRTTQGLLELAEAWSQRGINLVVHNLGGSAVDTGSATGRLLFTMLAAVGEMQRAIQAEKAAIGMAKAVADGKMQGGRPHKTKQIQEALRLLEQGLTKQQAAKAAGIGVATLYRALRD